MILFCKFHLLLVEVFKKESLISDEKNFLNDSFENLIFFVNSLSNRGKNVNKIIGNWDWIINVFYIFLLF